MQMNSFYNARKNSDLCDLSFYSNGHKGPKVGLLIDFWRRLETTFFMRTK